MRIGFWLLVAAGALLGLLGVSCLYKGYSIGLLAVPLAPPLDAIAYLRAEMLVWCFIVFCVQSVFFFVLAFGKRCDCRRRAAQ
jgi:hypothetical protein